MRRYLIGAAVLVVVAALGGASGVLLATALDVVPPRTVTVSSTEVSPPRTHTDGRGVYVVSTTTGDVVKIDPATLEVTETVPLRAAYLSSIAVAGDYLYYGSSSSSSPSSNVGRYDLAAGENDPTFIAQQFYAPWLRTSPMQPDVLFVGERGLSPANIQKWSVPSGGGEPALLARTEHGPMGSNLQDFEVSDDGTRIWSACGAPYDFLELNTSDLRLGGPVYPAVAYPKAVDSVKASDAEYLVGATVSSSSDPTIHLYRIDDPTETKHHKTAVTTIESGSVALSPDATKIYRVAPGAVEGRASIETLSAATGKLLTRTRVRISELFADGIQADPASGRVFVSLDAGVGVLDSRGALLRVIPVSGAGQILIT